MIVFIIIFAVDGSYFAANYATDLLSIILATIFLRNFETGISDLSVRLTNSVLEL